MSDERAPLELVSAVPLLKRRLVALHSPGSTGALTDDSLRTIDVQLRGCPRPCARNRRD